jgi:hypothetical protein
MMHRRWIPVIAALIVGAAVVIPVWLGLVSESTAIRGTLLLVAVSFGVKAVVFAVVRRRLGDSSAMTMFGVSLADWVASLAVLDVVLCYVFSAAYFYAQGIDLTACRPRNATINPALCLQTMQAGAMPQWMTIANRAAIATLVTLTIGTGVAVLWEMNRSREKLAVREIPPSGSGYDGPERRDPELPNGRRSTDYDDRLPQPTRKPRFLNWRFIVVATAVAVAAFTGGMFMANEGVAVTEKDLDCEDMIYQEQAQAVLEGDPSDPFDLDSNHNLVACEDLPHAPK